VGDNAVGELVPGPARGEGAPFIAGGKAATPPVELVFSPRSHDEYFLQLDRLVALPSERGTIFPMRLTVFRPDDAGPV